MPYIKGGYQQWALKTEIYILDQWLSAWGESVPVGLLAKSWDSSDAATWELLNKQTNKTHKTTVPKGSHLC